MKKIIAVFIVLAGAVASAADASPKGRTTPLQADIIGRFTGMLATQHVAHVKLDDALSEKVWKRLIESYDEEHCFFYQKDIRSFDPMRKKLDDALRARDASFGFDVYDVYVKRVRAGAGLATNLLARIEADSAAEANYRKKATGEYVFKGEGRHWPETEKDMLELWQRKLRCEILERLAEAELDAEEEQGEKVVFKDIVRELADDYEQQLATLDEPDPEDAFERFLATVGMVNDPHTLYLSPAMEKMLKAEMSLTFCGIGVRVDARRSGLYILEVMDGGPAAKDGRLKPGDRIVGIGDDEHPLKSVKGMPSGKAIRRISGKKGTKVVLEVVSAAGKHSRIELVRDKIKLKSEAAKSRVESVSLNGRKYKLGYLKLPAFYGPDSISMGLFLGTARSASSDVSDELEKLTSAGVQGLAFDLRGNGGGMLTEALMLSSLFVGGGPLAQIQSGDEVEVMTSPDGGIGFTVFRKPMVVLIDRSSASASELVSGLLKDRGRAVILGDRQTHGKGSMQGVIPLGRRRGEALITMGLFYRITGSSTQLKGVKSDILLPSIMNGIDRLGEDNMPFALPWRKVDAAKFKADWDMPSHVPELARRSSARQSSSAAYRAHMENVRAVAESCNRKSASLDYATVKARIRQDRKSGADRIGTGYEAAVAEDKELFGDDGMPIRDKDAVLDESLNVLADLVDLTKGADMPRRKDKKPSSFLDALFGASDE